ncbi:hypothetical protein HELRODRAFT_158736 [Helobdella robusta]|uniref:Uncharacterized protein n=1 Tax=Helobdella robusta TaxID=6412 RepID=T1EN65_HELRO|nr:hypothetical protein HELRODRAFT_158736 [Helobdella robusta]ESO12258.1 hypothetical protein HELRODRAFT_158736 [Helobdella robusta]
MASRLLVNHELLYFLENNWNLTEKDCFINNTSEFYSHEDITSGIKLLKYEISALKIEKVDKQQTRGNSKSEKLLECISIIKFLKENNYWEKCSVFVSVNMNKIPKVENFLTINFEKVKQEIMESLRTQQVMLNRTIEAVETNKLEISSLKHKLCLNAENNVNIEVKKRQEKTNNVQTSQTCWSEVTKSPTESTELPFTLVKHGKKNANNKVSQATKRTATKIIGKKVLENCKLKANKDPTKKPVFCISNVQRCRRSDVMEYLSANGINVITCYPVIKKTEEKISAKTNSNNSSDEQNELKNRDEEESTVFRVCIDREDVKKIKDPEIMPQHVIVREWRFDKKTEQTVQQKISDG